MIDLGIVKPGKTLIIPFATFDSNDPSASVTCTGLALADIKVYKDGGTTERASTAGFTLLDTDGIDFDSVTGIHGISIDIGDNTTAGFYAEGSQYFVVINSITVDAATINFVAASFRIAELADYGAGYQGPRGLGVYLDDAAANTTTVNGTDGTANNPVSTIAAAKTIADSLNVKRIYLVNDSAITLAATMDDYEFIGIGTPSANTIALGAQSVNNSTFVNVSISGTQGGSARAVFEDCLIGQTLTLRCFARRCGFTDSAVGTSFSNNDDIVLDQCFSTVAGNGTPIFLAPGAGVDAMFRHYSGGIELKNLNATATISIETTGQVVFNATNNVNAAVTIRGFASITDNTAGMNSLTIDAAWNRTAYAADGSTLTAIDLPNQTMDITGNLSGSVGSVLGGINTSAGVLTTLDALDTAQDTQHSTTQGLVTTVDTVVDGLTTTIGTAGAGLTNLGGSSNDWNTTTPPTVAAIADGVWDEAQSGHTTAGTFGKYLDTEVSGVGGGSAASIADAVWDELLSGHIVAGSTGEALAAAGTAGDPWITDLSTYTGSQAGKTVSDILADTNELQADDVPGLIAALDVVVDRVETDTQDIQTQIGTAGAGLTAMPDVTLADGVTHGGTSAVYQGKQISIVATDGATPAVTITGDSGPALQVTGTSGPAIVLQNIGVGTAISVVAASGIGLSLIGSFKDISSVTIEAILADSSELQTNQGNWLTATGFNTTTPPTVAAIADGVWTELIADHSGTAGSTAESLNAAGGAGDPWITAIPGAYSAGQAGYIVGTNLDAKVSAAGGGGTTIIGGSYTRNASTSFYARTNEQYTTPAFQLINPATGAVVDPSTVTLEVFIETSDKVDVETIADGALTKVSGASGTVQFTSAAATNASEAPKRWSIRDTTTAVVYREGPWNVTYSPE